MVILSILNILGSTSHSSKSDKGKATSSHSSQPSEKKASVLSKSSYSITGSSNASYLSTRERCKSAEYAKLAASRRTRTKAAKVIEAIVRA